MRVSHSVPATLGGEDVRRLLSGEDGGTRTLDLRAGAITVRFDCRFSVDEARQGGALRVSGLGVAPGAGFTADLAVSPGEGSLDVEGDVLVSGTLTGLGQRELGFWTRRLVEDVFAGP